MNVRSILIVKANFDALDLLVARQKLVIAQVETRDSHNREKSGESKCQSTDVDNSMKFVL